MPQHESFHEHSTQMGRRVIHERDNAKPCTHRAVFAFPNPDSPLQMRPAMLTALRKFGRRLPPSRGPGSVHSIVVTGDAFYQ
jgi:hypothetical protein